MTDYNTDHWNTETENIVSYIHNNLSLEAIITGMDEEGIYSEVSRWIMDNGDYIGVLRTVEWDEVERYFSEHDPDNVSPLPERKKTVEEIGQEVISQGLSTIDAVNRVVEAHQEAIELILDTLDDHAERMDRMKKQVHQLVLVHGS